MIDTHAPDCTCRQCERTDKPLTWDIEPSQARYRTAVAMQRLANALGVELDPSRNNCECLERLAAQAERLLTCDGSCFSGRPCPSREEIADERSPEGWKNHAE